MHARTPRPKSVPKPKEPMPTALRESVDKLAKRTGRKTVREVLDKANDKKPEGEA